MSILPYRKSTSGAWNKRSTSGAWNKRSTSGAWNKRSTSGAWNKRSTLLAVALLASGALTTTTAQKARAQTFTFEGTARTATDTTDPGALVTLVQTEGGVTLTLTRENGARFDINDLTQFGDAPPSFGARSLDPFYDDGNTAFIGNFSTTLSAVSVDFGDYGGDSDVFTLQAYSGLNATGTLLGTATVNYGDATVPTFGTGALAGLSGIQSIRFIGGAAGFENSVYYDNISVTQGATTTAVPEPSEYAAAGMFGATLLFGMVKARRKGTSKKATATA